MGNIVSFSSWQNVLKEKDAILIGVIIGLLLCLLMVTAEASYLLGVLDTISRRAKVVKPPETTADE
jgi:hypothetical protein